jgi:hypothetical protein
MGKHLTQHQLTIENFVTHANKLVHILFDFLDDISHLLVIGKLKRALAITLQCFVQLAKTQY